MVSTQGVESSTISTINFSILGSNKRFFDKLYEGSWSESSIYIANQLEPLTQTDIPRVDVQSDAFDSHVFLDAKEFQNI